MCYSIYTQTKNADKQICCALLNNNITNPFINFFKMPINLITRRDIRNSINTQTKIANKPICYALPNNNISNLFKIIQNAYY